MENNIVWHTATITREHRHLRNGHKSFILWFTGLSGAGKSTLAHAAEDALFKRGCNTFVFDGDNVRHGLCSDLGFSAEHRQENIRRIGEMSKLFVEAGIIAITAFISPFRNDRDIVRKLMGPSEFVEIHCDTSIEVCEQRDVKGLYQKARSGAIQEFTGISSPYEAPENPEIVLRSGEDSVETCTNQIIAYLIKQSKIKPA